MSQPAIKSSIDEVPSSSFVKENLRFAAEQYTAMLAQLDGAAKYPRTWASGKLTLTRAADWTSGFFPGSLWYLYEATGDAKWREAAAAYTAGLEGMKEN